MKDLKIYTGDLITFRFKFKLLKPRTWSNGLVGSWLKFRYKENYSHSGIYAYISGQPLVLQSSMLKGVNLENMRLIAPEIEIIITRDKNSKGAVRRGLKYLGKKYGILTILSHSIFILTGKWVKRPKQNDSYICSELAASVFGYKQPYKYNPVTLYRASKDNTIYKGTVGDLLSILNKNTFKSK